MTSNVENNNDVNNSEDVSGCVDELVENVVALVDVTEQDDRGVPTDDDITEQRAVGLRALNWLRKDLNRRIEKKNDQILLMQALRDNFFNLLKDSTDKMAILHQRLEDLITTFRNT